jgi:lipoprotein-releasing system permease protein
MNSTLTRSLASRYFRGKRSANAVPILSRISMVAITVGSCALIVLLSVFNGLEYLVKDMYKCFYPDIKITAVSGKFFSLDDAKMNAIRHTGSVLYIAPVIEDNVLVTPVTENNAAGGSDEQITYATLKGVDSNYFHVSGVKAYIVKGRDSISAYPVPTAILGQHLADVVGADVNNVFSTLNLYYPNAKVLNPVLDPANAYQQAKLKPDGTFEVGDEFDSRYVIAPLPIVRQLFQEEGKVSSLEISIDKKSDPAAVQRSIQEITGQAFHVETRYEQNKTIYAMMRTEKWAVYVILLLVLLIASFNMVGALSLLVIEKAKDIAILRAMGALPSSIRWIFILEGLLWSCTGGAIGLLLGAAICYGQQCFGWVKLQGGFVVDAYPVRMQPSDFLLVLVTILCVGLAASWFPAIRATRVSDPGLKSS